MDPIKFTRELVDIDSTTGHELKVGEFLQHRLSLLGYKVTLMQVEENRFNILAVPPELPSPKVVFSTHMDTVPPFFKSTEDAKSIHGRGSCDAKGIIAAQIAAAERLKETGKGAGLLFVVGEERDSAGAKVANQQPIGSQFLINGEPTENHIALASKGALRVEVTASGRMAHSAYPELGESAIDKLLDALFELRKIDLPTSPEYGPTTVNIGIIEGGRATNVIADHARAQLLYRLIGSPEKLKQDIVAAVADKARTDFILEIPFLKLKTAGSLPTMVAKFTTDIPALSRWGDPVLLGPGSILVAHTEREHIEKKQLLDAVDIYYQVAKELGA